MAPTTIQVQHRSALFSGYPG
ncbi:hypothetical protein CCACVL1_12675 [Corchorus capsularis]|uniref:Uncharacterized protein n=1 Tax=Corchorus capsularis TaxID=210143 RepID=A0A1R3IEH8_COCAP|nr:hypothetical protein CCACVL1_12675 [Corchorus capsularis]